MTTTTTHLIFDLYLPTNSIAFSTSSPNNLQRYATTTTTPLPFPRQDQTNTRGGIDFSPKANFRKGYYYYYYYYYKSIIKLIILLL